MLYLKRKSSLILCGLFIYLTLGAQTARRSVSRLEGVVSAYADSLRRLSDKFAKWHYDKVDTLSNPYYFPLFTANTYYDDVPRRFFSLTDHNKSRQLAALDRISHILLSAYAKHPELIQHISDSRPDTLKPLIPGEVKPKPTIVHKDLEPGIDVPETNWGIHVRKPNFWEFKTNFAFQLMQNYVSDNWYKGGESNHSMLSSLLFQVNYDNKTRLAFNNKLEMRLGFQSTRGDTYHKYLTNSDLLRLTNELGLKASKHWSYSVMLQSWTQFCKSYKKNDRTIYSDFMSPFESLLSVGMKYSVTKQKFNFEVVISPVAWDYRYVDRLSLSPSFGLASGRHSKIEYGANITMNHAWTIVKNVNWSGRLYYYTNYHRTQVEWENTFNFIINKYLSSQFFLYPRFDDSVVPSAGGSYFQFKEYLSIGLNINL